MQRRAVASVSILLGLVFAGCLDGGVSKDADGTLNKKGKSSGALPGGDQFVGILPDGSLADPALLLDVTPLKGIQRFIGYESYEPTLGIHPKTGAVFMSALDFKGPGGNPRPFVRASMDQGATWKDVSPRLPNGEASPPISFDPFVFSDPVTGRIFTADLQALLCNWLAYSDDEGKTWTTNPIGCGHPFGVHDHQSLITGKARVTPSAYQNRMVYYCVNRVGDSSCASSNNGGLAFGPLRPAVLGLDVEAARLCGGLHGHVKADNAGRVLLPKAQCGVPMLFVSEDDGLTWTQNRISAQAARGWGGGNLGDHEVAVAADASDNLYAFWIGETGFPLLAISKDHGRTWTPARNVAPPGVTATDKPTIYASAEGKVAFAYIGTTHPGGYAQNRNASSWVGATWNAYLGVMTDALEPNSIVLTTTLNDPADPIAINQCGGTRCQGLYDFIDVEIDHQGRPWAALVDVCHETCISAFAKEPQSARHDGNKGFAGTLATGPALTKEGGPLPPLADLVVPASVKP